MTGVSAFLFFSQAHNHHNQGRHTHMPQSFTSMDAGTQTPTKTKRKDVPTYPEPEGDPSY
jgi:hypothetical protein